MPAKSTDTHDLSESDEDSECSEITAPDGGYGWVIVIASFIINCIADGLTLSCGILFVELKNKFEDGYGKTAFITSLFSGLPMFIAPFGCFLIEVYDCRKVTFAGSLIAAFGFILSAFAPSVGFLCFSFGILAAIGMSLLFVPAIIIVSQYFDSRLALATGICSSGSGVGTLIFPPLITYLIDHYSYSGTFVLLAGILLNCCVCAAFYRPVKVCGNEHAPPRTATATSLPADPEANVIGESTPIIELTADNHNHISSAADNSLPACYHGRSLWNLPEDTTDFCERRWTVTAQNGADFKPTATLPPPPAAAAAAAVATRDPKRRIYHRSELVELLPPMDRHAVAVHRNRRPFFHVHQHYHYHQHQHHQPGHTTKPMRDFSSCPELAINHSNLAVVHREEMRQKNSGTDRKLVKRKLLHKMSMKKRFFKFWRMIFDVDLLMDWKFIIFFLSNVVLYAWYDLPYLFLPDFGREIGIDETSTAMLISILGGMNTIGQIAVGYLGDLPCVDPVVLYALWIVITGASNMFFPFFTSFAALVVYVSVFGIFVSANYSLCSVIIVNLFGIEKLTTGYGLLLLGQGFSNSVFPPVIGFLRDSSGNYNAAFCVTGISIIVSGLLLIPIHFCKTKHSRYNHSRCETESDDALNSNSHNPSTYK